MGLQLSWQTTRTTRCGWLVRTEPWTPRPRGAWHSAPRYEPGGRDPLASGVWRAMSAE
jgi:hypothetical protein